MVTVRPDKGAKSIQGKGSTMRKLALALAVTVGIALPSAVATAGAASAMSPVPCIDCWP